MNWKALFGLIPLFNGIVAAYRETLEFIKKWREERKAKKLQKIKEETYNERKETKKTGRPK